MPARVTGTQVSRSAAESCAIRFLVRSGGSIDRHPHSQQPRYHRTGYKKPAHENRGLRWLNRRKRLISVMPPLTIKEAAKELNVSPRTISDLCGKGRIRHYRFGVGRGTVRIERADLEAYRDGATVEPKLRHF